MAEPLPWFRDPRARRAQRRYSVLFILLGLVAATGAKIGYERAIQAPACFDYARSKGLPDLDELRFEGVVIAGKQRVHSCIFRHDQREAPVLLRFDDAEVPRGRDNGQILAMIGAFLLVSGFGAWRWERWLKRNGFTLLGGFRPADPAT